MQVSSKLYQYPVLLYFYFRESDQHNNNASAAMLSITHQLSKQHEGSRSGIVKNRRSLSKQKQDPESFQLIWDWLSMFLTNPTNLVMVLDGLDECRDIDVFFQSCCPKLAKAKPRFW